VAVEKGPERSVPSLRGGVRGHEAAPNRRGAELVGLVPGEGCWDANSLLTQGAEGFAVLLVAGDLGEIAHDAAAVARLRQAEVLIVLGWADSPLAQAADIALPIATHVECDGTFVNSQWRLQRFDFAFPAPGQSRPGVDVLVELLGRLDRSWAGLVLRQVFDRMAEQLPAFAGLTFDRLPATGTLLEVAAAEPYRTDEEPPAEGRRDEPR
jgi:predicted molibdopterin-dependent oxidoreductase YjgC